MLLYAASLCQIDCVFSVSVKKHTDLLISLASLLENLFVQPAFLLHFATSYK